MTDDFDGYRKWLNITSPRRPPSHYELLGIKLDEDDHEVIEAAIEQRRNYVESKRGKGHDDLVAEILMRIDEAGITLLNHEMRRDYDQHMALFEKRRKNRRVDPNATSSRFESRPGKTVGEDGGFVKTFAGIMAVICLGFGIMAWFSFQLPWNKPLKESEVAQTPTPHPIVPQIQQPPASAPTQAQQSNSSTVEQLVKPVDVAAHPETKHNEHLAGTTVFKGHSYKVYPEALDWRTAEARCEAMGGHLVTVGDQAENGFITALATEVIGDINNTGIWLGATDERMEGEWEWVDGTPFKYSDWSKGQPNNKGGGENHLFLLLYFRGPAGNDFRGWCDQPNDSKQHLAYFACEWDSATDQQFVEQTRPTESPKQISELFRQGSMWSGGGFTLTVIDRAGETFSARFETDDWARIIKGTVKNNQVTWLAKDVQPIKGPVGGDNYGLISSDQDGHKIEIEWRQPNGKSGKFTIRLNDDGKRTFLITLPRIDLRDYNGWWSDKGELLLGGVGGKPIDRKPLIFEGKHSVHGIYMHARPSGESFITFKLSGRFNSFETKAHIPEMLPNQGDPLTPLVFKVIGDGRTLWKSKPLSKKGDHEPCSVSVKGINDLSLKIECPGPDNWALASWIEPHLIVAETEVPQSSAPEPRDDDRAAAENVMNAGGRLELLIDGKKVLVEKGGVLPNQVFRISRIDLKDLSKVVDHDLQFQPNLSELRELILMATSISDATFQPLTKYKKLVELNVAGTTVNGSGFRHLKENESLEILLCGGCPIMDTNLVHLKSCKRLSVLGLIDTKVTDAGMEHLNDIPTLKELRLNGDRVTDKGIEKLTKLKGLTKLTLGRTKVTPAGVNAFKKALPDCDVQLQ